MWRSPGFRTSFLSRIVPNEHGEGPARHTWPDRRHPQRVHAGGMPRKRRRHHPDLPTLTELGRELLTSSSTGHRLIRQVAARYGETPALHPDDARALAVPPQTLKLLRQLIDQAREQGCTPVERVQAWLGNAGDRTTSPDLYPVALDDMLRRIIREELAAALQDLRQQVSEDRCHDWGAHRGSLPIEISAEVTRQLTELVEAGEEASPASTPSRTEEQERRGVLARLGLGRKR